MDAALATEALALRDTVARLDRLGLVVDPAALAPATRRAAYAAARLEAARLEAAGPAAAAPARPRIGFAYPNAR